MTFGMRLRVHKTPLQAVHSMSGIFLRFFFRKKLTFYAYLILTPPFCISIKEHFSEKERLVISVRNQKVQEATSEPTKKKKRRERHRF